MASIPQSVIDYCARWKIHCEWKTASLPMLVFGFVLNLLWRSNDFMLSYASTLGETIYLPAGFTLDPGPNYVENLGQLRHEVEHVLQYRRTKAAFILWYVSPFPLLLFCFLCIWTPWGLLGLLGFFPYAPKRLELEMQGTAQQMSIVGGTPEEWADRFRHWRYWIWTTRKRKIRLIRKFAVRIMGRVQGDREV